MFTVQEPATLNKPWRLSSNQDPLPVFIPKELTKQLKNYHIIGIEFVYNNYKKGLNGAILNQEYDMNLPLEITAFLRAVFIDKGVVLVISPDHLFNTWHYYLTNYSTFTIKTITSENVGESSPESHHHQTVLLLKFSNLKLLESLVDLQYFCIVIDKFDELATKLVLNKLQSRFKIGTTYRNFTGNTNQKIQWKLLNWSNPGCVGQLSKFPQIDNENYQEFRDNYHYWWLHLTWRYDDERFQRPTPEEIDDLKRTVKNWAKSQHLTDNDDRIPRKIRKNKRKIVDSTVKVQTKKIVGNYVRLPSMEESPILTLIRRNFEESPEAMRSHDDHQPSTSKICSESEHFLLNLIENHPNGGDHEQAFVDQREDSLSKRILDTLKVADDLLHDQI